MAHSSLMGMAPVAMPPRSMPMAPTTRLVPLAGLLFLVGGVVGFSATMGLKGCVAGPALSEVGSGAEASGPRAGGGGEQPGSGAAQPPSAREPTEEGEAGGLEAESGREPLPSPLPEGVPDGRAIAAMDPEVCDALLDGLDVPVDREAESVREARDAVTAPLLLAGPVGGVTFVHVGRSETHEVVDCRLVVALLRWAPALREAGVTKVEHMSMHRPDSKVRGSGEQSGHAVALAIDAARFELEDGEALDVLEDWSDKKRGAEPCAEREDEPDEQAILRKLVCDALDQDLFQVAITPHHNRAHRNHVHLELVPDVDWSYVR